MPESCREPLAAAAETADRQAPDPAVTLAAELEQVHAALARGGSPAEMLDAALLYIGQQQPMAVELHLLDAAPAERAPALQRAAAWSHPTLAQPLTAPTAVARLLVSAAAPTEPVQLIPDVATAEPLTAEVRDLLVAEGVAALAALALHSPREGAWHGLLIITWAAPRSFAAVESMAYRLLSRSITAFIAGRRAQAAQAESLAEMQMLYEIAAKLNAAADMHDFLSVLAAPVATTICDHARLYLIDVDANGQPLELELAAEWGVPVTPRPLGERRPLGELERMWLRDPDTPVILDDIANDLHFSGARRQRILEHRIQALVLLPLRTRDRWVGMASMMWRTPFDFSPRIRRLFAGVMQQAAVALDNRRLLRRQHELIQAQEKALAERSTPLIPIGDRIMVMPIIGSIDAPRAAMMMESLLAGISRSGAAVALIDITGVPTVDSQAATGIINAARAVRLLGAEVVLTGIRAEVALMLVRLGLDLTSIVTQATLQAGIAYAQRPRK